MSFRTVFLGILAVLFSFEGHAQYNVLGQDSTFRAITTAVPFLSITPDARHAALGDAGVATSPDASSSYWNAGQLVFVNKTYGASMSYTPWLGKLVPDMWIAYLSGYYKFSQQQAVSFGFRYFDLGDIFFTEDGKTGTNFNPKEWSFDVTYSRMLTEHLSLGISGRFINSNLTGSFTSSTTNTDARPGHTAAADIGIYYKKEIGANDTLSLGASISNLGGKLSYSDNNNKDFIPTNLRVGGAYTKLLDEYNSFTFILDFDKLMVPSPPIYKRVNGDIQYVDGKPVILRGKDPDRSFLSGTFGSFTDAPDGFKEEIQEITTSAGVEYWYHETFSGRIGYFLEAKNKGDRKYMTLGLGFRKNQFGVDVAYLVPTNKREHPLAETLRFTIILQSLDKPDKAEESVTD